jgi:hypothetical protein
MTSVNVNVVNQNNVDLVIEPPTRNVINLTPPAQQTISINRGLIGPAGAPGPNEIGGYPVNITSAQQYDVLMFGTNEWVNTPQTEITDGGNY